MYQVYLSGGTANMSIREQNEWRKYVTKELEKDSKLFKDKLCIFNPYDCFNYNNNKHVSEKQIMMFELDKVRNSNLIIVNFNNPISIGTTSELSVAYENRIPIIGLNSDNLELHPWLSEMCEVVFKNVDDLIAYVRYFHLIN